MVQINVLEEKRGWGEPVNSAQYGEPPEKAVVIVRLVATHCFSWCRWWHHFGHFSHDPGQGLGKGWYYDKVLFIWKKNRYRTVKLVGSKMEI